jgi:hypothetical protein
MDRDMAKEKMIYADPEQQHYGTYLSDTAKYFLGKSSDKYHATSVADPDPVPF